MRNHVLALAIAIASWPALAQESIPIPVNKQRITADPTSNYVFEVRQSAVNSIITPFAKPIAKSASSAALVEVEASSVLVSPQDDHVITLEISGGPDKPNVTFTLRPKADAPILHLTFDVGANNFISPPPKVGDRLVTTEGEKLVVGTAKPAPERPEALDPMAVDLGNASQVLRPAATEAKPKTEAKPVVTDQQSAILAKVANPEHSPAKAEEKKAAATQASAPAPSSKPTPLATNLRVASPAKPSGEPRQAVGEQMNTDAGPIPVIPLTPSSASPMAPKAAPKAVATDNSNPASPAGNAGYTEVEAEAIEVRPGTTHIINVSRMHLNRIVTMFRTPSIRTTSTASIEVKGNVIYVSAVDDQPIALYVTQDGNESEAIALTLVPRALPPRELRLTMSDRDAELMASGGPNRGGDPVAQNWESEQPYVNTIRALMRELASGQIPPGYRLHKHTTNDPAVFCSNPYFSVTPVQVLEGSNLIVTVSSIKNIAQVDQMVTETDCAMPGVAAVAAWPTPFLRPSQSSELYMVHRRQQRAAQARDRPSVIDPAYLR